MVAAFSALSKSSMALSSFSKTQKMCASGSVCVPKPAVKMSCGCSTCSPPGSKPYRLSLSDHWIVPVD